MAGAAPLPPGRIKTTPADFVVEELAAYEPSGAGEHVYVRLTKTDLTTPELLRRVTRALGCQEREAGYAGMKDRRAVTTQTLSLKPPRGVRPDDLAARARALSLDGVVVRDVALHGNKLKPGHLAGNRFALAVRGVPRERLADAGASLERLAREGVPNAFGAQRFGRERDNAARARAWLRGEAQGPREPRMQRLLWSALQSAVFNAVLDERVQDGSWRVPLAGDLLKLRSSGGLFLCTDVQADLPRAASGEVSPTGPMIGAGMRWPEGAAEALERRISSGILGEDFDLGATSRLGEGTRRALRVWIEDLRWEVEDGEAPEGDACMRVYFVLPKGAYATTVLGAVFDLQDPEQTHAEGHPG